MDALAWQPNRHEWRALHAGAKFGAFFKVALRSNKWNHPPNDEEATVG